MNQWGIDSSGTFGAVYPATVARLGKPAFIGRYLYQIQGVSDGLTPAEVTDIHAAGLALLLIANDTSAASVAGSYDEGRNTGLRAIAVAKGLGAPIACGIAVDWESNMSPSVDWTKGYIDGIHAGNYVPIFYLNPGVPSHSQAYSGGWSGVGQAAYWSSEPELDGWRDKVRLGFTPWTIPGHEAEAVIHQYSENNLGGLVDLNVATPEGFALMWGPTPPAPATKHVAVPGSLKVFASHASNVAIDIHGKAVYLEVGAAVVPTGKTSAEWSEVHLVPPESVVHGWLLTANIA